MSEANSCKILPSFRLKEIKQYVFRWVMGPYSWATHTSLFSITFDILFRNATCLLPVELSSISFLSLCLQTSSQWASILGMPTTHKTDWFSITSYSSSISIYSFLASAAMSLCVSVMAARGASCCPCLLFAPPPFCLISSADV